MPSYRCLTPSKFRLRRHRFANIGSGSFQSFAIQEHGTVWGWGSNLYGEGGQESGHIDKIGDGFSIPAVPRVIPAFDIEAGRLFRWGNNAGWQCGGVKREDDPVEMGRITQFFFRALVSSVVSRPWGDVYHLPRIEVHG